LSDTPSNITEKTPTTTNLQPHSSRNQTYME